jgi:hypothetical protein
MRAAAVIAALLAAPALADTLSFTAWKAAFGKSYSTSDEYAHARTQLGFACLTFELFRGYPPAVTPAIQVFILELVSMVALRDARLGCAGALIRTVLEKSSVFVRWYSCLGEALPISARSRLIFKLLLHSCYFLVFAGRRSVTPSTRRTLRA